MKWLSHTFKSPAANLACDEALLDIAEAAGGPEVLRLWQPRDHFVVLGLSNQAATEVKLGACRQRQIPVLRRFSGGGTVLQGPGCLNFSLILRIKPGPLESITSTTRFILERHKELFSNLTQSPVSIEGTSDLTVNHQKFSGHAQRRKRRAVLFHGSILLGADLELMQMLLRLPSLRPAYRNNRAHNRFLTNLKLSPDAVSAALKKAWGATEVLKQLPDDSIESLVRTRYATDTWNYRL